MACVFGDDASRCCASCRRVFDVALILPCSHTLCAGCLAEGAGPGLGVGVVRGVASASRPICTVLCSNCRHSVELPCFDWSSALTCLPFDPTVTPDPKASEETGECEYSSYVHYSQDMDNIIMIIYWKIFVSMDYY